MGYCVKQCRNTRGCKVKTINSPTGRILRDADGEEYHEINCVCPVCGTGYLTQLYGAPLFILKQSK